MEPPTWGTVPFRKSMSFELDAKPQANAVGTTEWVRKAIGVVKTGTCILILEGKHKRHTQGRPRIGGEPSVFQCV